ncbi:MAG TPA: SDR family oxidoreductase [Balneolales bacterium]|nr:SDR family oxidoreductase [Balneolales bacterium]
MKDKVILVTGGGGLDGSIGETIVQSIAKENAIPVIIDKHPRGKRIEEAFKEQGKQSLFVQADLRNEEECKKVIEKALSKFGKIDGLVNNLGINDGAGLDGSVDNFIASLQLNLVHFFTMTKYSLDALKKSKGVIINIASKVAVTGQGGTSGYAASKGGVLALTREWALDLRAYGIRVNAMIISESWTPGYKEWVQKFDNPGEKLKFINDKIPLEKRMTTPEEIANTVLFLLSDRSSHTTGQHVYVDGGYVHLDRAIS